MEGEVDAFECVDAGELFVNAAHGEQWRGVGVWCIGLCEGLCHLFEGGVFEAVGFAVETGGDELFGVDIFAVEVVDHGLDGL